MPEPGLGLELQLASVRLDALRHGSQPDVAFQESLAAPVDVIPLPSSITCSSIESSAGDDPDARACRARMLRHVREELPRESQDELVIPPKHAFLDLNVDGQPVALTFGLPCNRPERRLEAALLERDRVEGDHGLAELSDRRADDVVGSHDLLAARRRLHQVLVRSEQALQSIVVDQLGDSPPRAILGFHHLRDELLPFSSSASACGELAPQLIDLRTEIGVAHSSRPRLMPSATAAARSDTPSFSYIDPR